ncbi:MAG: GIDE domain-containing protein [Candidatus Woesearchaeota archaeon]|nr:GIDE domain-containing protein [Candidatus Woesearchaeota archaeon]
MADEGFRLFLYMIIGFIAGLWFFVKGLILLKRKQLIENTPTSNTRGIAMGPVEVYGEVLLKKDSVKLTSPFTKKPCIYYRYLIQEYRYQGKSSRWVTLDSGQADTRFFLKDDADKVLVDPAKAMIEIPANNTFNSGIGKNPPAMIVDFLNKSKIKDEGLFGINKTMRYTEYFIEPGDKIYIMGTAGKNPEVDELAAQQSMENVMIQDRKGAFFYISDRPEKEILKSFRNKMLLYTIGGAALSSACLAGILLYTGLLFA